MNYQKCGSGKKRIQKKVQSSTAGSRFEQKLPVGEAPFQLYSLGTPNGIKVYDYV